MGMLVGVVRRLKPKTGSPVKRGLGRLWAWKPAVNGGPTRCAKNPVNGVQWDAIMKLPRVARHLSREATAPVSDIAKTLLQSGSRRDPRLGGQ